MGLNCGIIKHSGNAGILGAVAASLRIDDDLSGRCVPGREDQSDNPGQPSRDHDRPNDQFPAAAKKVDELAQVKSRRLLRVHGIRPWIELLSSSYIRVSSTKRELRDGGRFQEAEHDSEPEDWMADNEVEHAEYDERTRERGQSR
jgi:hypothetical protein